MMRNKKKWRDLEVGGTAANSSTKANLPCEESGFWRYFCWFLGSGGVPWGHGWVTHPRGLRMGWADAEKLGFVQI